VPKHQFEISELKPGVFSVVRVIARMNVGGPAQHVANLTRGLSAGYPTLLVTGDVESDEVEFPFADDLPFVRVAELGRRIRPGQDLLALIKLIRILRRVRPAIVHTHTAKGGTLGRIAAILSGVPVRVHTFHGHVFEGYFAPRTARAFIAIERALARFTTRVIAISPSQARDLIERFRICEASRVAVVPLGLNLAAFREPEDTRVFRAQVGAGDAFVVTSVGRLAPVKNHDLLLDAADRLRDENIMFVIVGGGSEEARLRSRVREMGLTDRVIFTGWESDLRKVYSGSDLVVLTSLNEGTPVCLLEAIAAGVPVAASAVGGVADVLGHGRNGTLFPSGDAAALTEAIRAAAAGSHESAALAKASGDVIERYSVQRLVQDVRTLYEDLLVAARRLSATDVTNRRIADAERSLSA
jgi:glycosyltransferase involved in cell wall biosynthesis